MAMTMPVEIARGGGDGGDGATMSFVLPREQAAAQPFAGIVTDEEVARQREVLLAAIAADGGTRPLDAGAYSVLQYNSPLTVPWRRRNELAIVVEPVEDGGADGEAEAQDVVSWYDA